mgnify:CR=1 FL=1
MELSLKDESVIEIGRAVGNNVNSLAGGGGSSLVPVGAGATAGPPAVVAQPMNPFDSMMTVLGDIRDGIYSLVDKFSDSVSLQKDQIQDANMAQDLAQVSDAGEGASDEGIDPAPKQSFFSKAKDKVKSLMGMGGFKGMLVKGGLIFGLLGIATMLKKYGAEIAKVVTPIVDGIKNFYNYIKDDLLTFGDDVLQYVKDAFGALTSIFTGLFGGDGVDGTLIKEGLVELLALPEFLAAIGKLALGVLDAFLGVFGMNDPKPEWLTKMYEFLDELPAKVKQFFVDVMEFFTVTIPEKIQSAKDTVTQWFTDAVAGVKQFFTDVGNFFTVTIPTKLTETYENITNWFGDIVGGIKGFFTDAFDFVTETIPEKMSEITKGISDKFTSIKDQIIDFAMTPFRKIRELFDNLVIGILESVEGIPLIGGKAKEMKEAILQKREIAAQDQEQKDAEAGAFDNLSADLKKHEDKINDFVAATGLNFDLEGSLYHYKRGVKKLRFASGDDSSNILTDTFGDEDKIGTLIGDRNAAIQNVATTTGGATGTEMNNEGAAFARYGKKGGGGDANTYIEGARVNTVSSNQTHMTEDTGSNDKTYKDAILD